MTSFKTSKSSLRSLVVEDDYTQLVKTRLPNEPMENLYPQRIALPDRRTQHFCASATGSGTGRNDYQIPQPRFRKDDQSCHTSQLKYRSSPLAAESIHWEGRAATVSQRDKNLQYQTNQMNALGVYVDENNSPSNVSSPKKIKSMPVLDKILEQCQTPIQDRQSTSSGYYQAKSPQDKVLPPLPQHPKPSEDIPLIVDSQHRPIDCFKPEARAWTPVKRTLRQSMHPSPLQTDLSSTFISKAKTTTSPSPTARQRAVPLQPCSSTDNLRPRHYHHHHHHHYHHYHRHHHHDFDSPRSPPLPPIPLNVQRPKTAPYSNMTMKDSPSTPLRCNRFHGRVNDGGCCNPLEELVTHIVGLLCSCTVFNRKKHRLDRRSAKDESTNSLEYDRVKKGGIPFGKSGWDE